MTSIMTTTDYELTILEPLPLDQNPAAVYLVIGQSASLQEILSPIRDQFSGEQIPPLHPNIARSFNGVIIKESYQRHFCLWARPGEYGVALINVVR
jgi:hypothetical protein